VFARRRRVRRASPTRLPDSVRCRILLQFRTRDRSNRLLEAMRRSHYRANRYNTVVLNRLHRRIAAQASHLPRRHRHLDHVEKIQFRINVKGVFTLPASDRWPEILRRAVELYCIPRCATIVLTLQRSRFGARRRNFEPCRATTEERHTKKSCDQSKRDVQGGVTAVRTAIMGSVSRHYFGTICSPNRRIQSQIGRPCWCGE
jgi:hypothetical protein